MSGLPFTQAQRSAYEAALIRETRFEFVIDDHMLARYLRDHKHKILSDRRGPASARP